MGTVTVKSKFGNFGTVDESDLSSALSHGYAKATNDEIKDYNDRIEYGSGLANPLIAGAEEAASTATFGASRELENLTGLTTPEAQAGRAKFNPTAHKVGTLAGIVLDPAGLVGKTTELGGKVAEGAAQIIGKAPEGAGFLARAVRNVPAVAAGTALEGAAFGVGQSVGEHAMGDPDALGEHLMANVGYGSLLAGGLGGLMEGGANAFGTSMLKGPIANAATEDASKLASYQNDIQKSTGEAELADAQGMATPPTQTPFNEFPKSIEEIQKAVKTNFPIVPEGMPSYQALKDIDSRLPDLQFKTHNLQLESLKDPGLRDLYKTFLEGQSDESKALRHWEALQKSESITKLDNTIKDLAPDQEIAKTPVQAGESAIKSFTKQYEAEKEELAPLFKKFDELAENKKINPLNPLLKVHDAIPGLGEYLNADENGVFQLSKYSGDMPFNKPVYKAVKELVETVNKEDLTLSKLRNVREKMRGKISLSTSDLDRAQIQSIRKSLMDSMQEYVSELAPEASVRDTFKRYAINEQERDVIEKIVGGSISDKASFGKMIKPENVLDRIFGNTVHVNAAKQILGKDFGKVLADYLAVNRSKVTDEVKNGFSSNKFSSFLKQNRSELDAALKDTPQVLQRINDLTDRMRILPDAPSVNPSGTAKTLGIMDKIAGLSRNLKPTHAIQDYLEKFAEKSAQDKQRYTISEVLAGKHLGAAKQAADELHLANSKLARIERMAQNVAFRVKANAEALFKTGVETARKSVGVIGSKLVPSPQQKVPLNDDASYSKHHDIFAKLQELQSNPEEMMNTLQKSVASISDQMPNISQGAQIAATRATQFLTTKMPPMMPKSAFSNDKYLPSDAELTHFERYYNTVEDPIGVLHDVKIGMVQPEALETLNVVYPKLYGQMKQEVLAAASDYMKNNKAIPFRLRQSMSQFIGEPVDKAMDPQSIARNQAIYQSLPDPNQGQAKPSKAGMQKIDLAKRMGMGPTENA